MLEASYRTVRLRPKDAIDLTPLAGIARLISELEFFLHASYCVAATTFLHLNDQSGPCPRADYAISH